MIRRLSTPQASSEKGWSSPDENVSVTLPAVVAKLKANGVPHEYHVYEGEGHGWRKSETIEHFYGAVERFLKQYVLFA